MKQAVSLCKSCSNQASINDERKYYCSR